MAGEIIRPSDLPARATPVASEIVPVDNGSTVGGATIAALVAAGRPLASQAEAEAGVEATKAMTPLTTKQAINALGDVRFATAVQGDLADSAIQTVTAGSGITVDDTDPQNPIITYSGGGVSDGNKGDVTVSSSGAAWAVNAGAITRAKVEGDFAKGIGLNVFEYGAVGNGTTNDAAAFAATQAAAISTGSKLVVVPAGNYRISTQVDIDDDVTWLFLGANINTATDTMHIFSAVEVNGWAVLGRVTLNGSLVTPAVADQVGLYIENCDRYVVENVSAVAFKGKGFWLTGDDAVGSLRGDRGQFSGCSAYDCTVGRQVDAGAGAEYTTWTNWHASGNATGDIIGAGNTITSGFSIVDNDVGAKLVDGTNHGHGSYSNGNINHNTVNIEADDIVNGFTFSGVHIFEGEVQITNCAGIVIDGGILDADVVVTTGASHSWNYIRNMWCPASYGTVLITGTGAAKMVVQGLTGPGVPTNNTLCEIEAHAYRNKGSTQVLTSGVAAGVIFPGETSDTAGAYDASTGIFTIPAGQAGIYEVSWTIVCGGTGLTSSSYCELQADVDGGADSWSPQAFGGPELYSTTLLSFKGCVAGRYPAGAQIRMLVAVTGTSPVIGHASYYCFFSVKKLGS